MTAIRFVRGVTLIEALITLSILAFVLALAAPAFATMMRDNRLATGANAMLGSLQLARSEAVRRGHYVTTCVSTDFITCSGDTNAGWHDGWLVFADTNNNAGLDEGEEVLRVVERSTRLSITGNTNVTHKVSYMPGGRSAQAGTISLCTGGTGRQLVISLAGRIRMDDKPC